LRCFDAVIVNSVLPAPELLESYRREGAEPVRDDLGERNEFGVRAVRADLLGTARLLGKTTAKHDPAKLARVIAHATRAFARGPL
jgi:hypothetical protein